MTIAGILLGLARRTRQWYLEGIDDVFRRSAVAHAVRERQRRPEFEDRAFYCEPRDGWKGEPIILPGHHLTPTDKVLQNQNTDGAPSWLQFSKVLVQWSEDDPC